MVYATFFSRAGLCFFFFLYFFGRGSWLYLYYIVLCLIARGSLVRQGFRVF